MVTEGDQIVADLVVYDLAQLKKLGDKRYLAKAKKLTGLDDPTDGEVIAVLTLGYENKSFAGTCRKLDRLVAAGEIKATP